MKRAIVTGATGFIGNAILQELYRQGVEVIALSRFKKANIPSDVCWIEYDMANCKTVLEKIPAKEIDVIYHCAWAGVSGSSRASADLQLQNVQWTLDLIKLAKTLNCKRVVCTGSIMEQETLLAGLAQGNKPGAGYVYGAGKLAAHLMGMSLAADLGIDLIWAEITNAYGAGEDSPRLINATIRNILHDKPLEFTAATQNYDFIYIDDVAKALYLLGVKGRPYHHYLIGSPDAKSLKEFLLEMQETLAPEKEFIFGKVPFTGVSLPLEYFDISMLEQHTGFRAQISFKEGIQRTKTWIEQQEQNKA